MSINAYSRQKLENLELYHKEKWDYNSYNLRFRIYLDGRNSPMWSENEKRIKEFANSNLNRPLISRKIKVYWPYANFIFLLFPNFRSPEIQLARTIQAS